jgi:hypothetical protein
MRLVKLLVSVGLVIGGYLALISGGDILGTSLLGAITGLVTGAVAGEA